MRRRTKTYRRIERAFPEDFPQRLERLKEASGLSWRQFTRHVGADRNTVRQWRKGRKPNAVSMLALLELARDVDGGHEALMANYYSPALDAPGNR